jgi:hypothetical protein
MDHIAPVVSLPQTQSFSLIVRKQQMSTSWEARYKTTGKSTSTGPRSRSRQWGKTEPPYQIGGDSRDMTIKCHVECLVGSWPRKKEHLVGHWWNLNSLCRLINNILSRLISWFWSCKLKTRKDVKHLGKGKGELFALSFWNSYKSASTSKSKVLKVNFKLFFLEVLW